MGITAGAVHTSDENDLSRRQENSGATQESPGSLSFCVRAEVSCYERALAMACAGRA